MKSYTHLFFDLDGTLTDPALGITNAVMYALKKFSIPLPPREQLFPFIGPPLKDSFAVYYHLTGEANAQAIRYYREYFRAGGMVENEVYPGIPQRLADLKAQGRILAVASSKPEEFVQKILEHFQLASYFSLVCGAAMDETRTEKPEVVAYALQSCGNPDTSQVLMIGDRRFDMEGAQQNGLDSLGVAFGYGGREELSAAGATYIADTVDDLRRLLLG